MTSDQATRGIVGPLRWLIVLVFAASAAYFAVASIHWPLMCDSPVMHYVTFLMDHGKQPYRDITDNNMPGSYLTEALAMRVFGGGDLGWRIYDFALLGSMILSMMVIARRYDWVAGVYGGGLFLLLYGAQGPNLSVEREEIITALFLAGYVALFAAVRRQRPALMLPFGVLAGVAASIKPTFFPLGVVLALVACYVLHRRGVRFGRYLMYAALGCGVIFALDLGFLLYHHALRQFWFVLHEITPTYVGMKQARTRDLIRNVFPKRVLFLLFFFGLPLAWLNRRWNWERWALVLGVGFGIFSLVLQHKGFFHHRYVAQALAFFLLGIELMTGLEWGGWRRVIAATGILVTLCYTVPQYLRDISYIPGRSLLTEGIETDLTRLGGERQLQDKVMCFDLVYGCLNALYHLHLVENTGFTGDMLVFYPRGGRGTAYYRQMFWDLERRDPADVLVVTNEWFLQPNSYRKLDAWSEFRRYLDRNYTEVEERSFPLENRSFFVPEGGDIAGYRIYIRNSTPLLPAAEHEFAPASAGALPSEDTSSRPASSKGGG